MKEGTNMVIRADEMAKSLKEFGRLPKPLTIKICDHFWDGKERRMVKHSLVTVIHRANTVTVAHDTLRKCMESLSNQSVNVDVKEDGMHIKYTRGELFLRHQPGQWIDAVEMKLGG